jgi:AraC-like DNA-binding protein
MSMLPRIADGFEGQEFFLQPRPVISRLASHPLAAGLHLCGAGYFPVARYHYVERTRGYPDHILIYVIEGRGWYSVGGVERAVEKDTLLLVPANLPHAYGADNNAPWTIHWLTFGGEMSGEYRSCFPENAYQTPVARNIRPRVIDLFLELFEILRHGHSVRNLVCASKVAEHVLGLLLFNNEALVTGPGVLRYRDITRSIQHMRKSLRKSPSVEELASQANMSAVQFWRLFKEQTGFAPMDYFIRMKIQLACQLLSSTDRPLKEIADFLGYKDYYYFSRVFKKVMGIPPSEYQREAIVPEQ